MVFGELRREVCRGPVRIDADADDGPRVVRSEAVGLAEHAGELAEAPAAAGLDDEVVRPLEADRAGRQARDRLGRIRHRERDDRAGRQSRSAPATPAGSRSSRGARRPAGASQVRPLRPRPAVCSSAMATQTSAAPSAGQPRRRRCRADDGEAFWRARSGGHRGARGSPAAATSIISGRSSSNAPWSASNAAASSPPRSRR